MPNTVKCPSCGNEVNVEAVLEHQIEERIKQQYGDKIAAMETDYKKKESSLAAKERELKKQTEESEERIAKEVDKQVASSVAKQRYELQRQLETKIKSEYEVKLQSLSEEANETKEQLQELKNAQIENERLKRQFDAQQHNFQLEIEKKLAESETEQRKRFNQMLKEEADTISKREAERVDEKVQELQKQLADARKAAEDAVRKSEQKSQQLQGEIQELMIEEFLKETFPYDCIEEVKKGQYGADVMHIVCDSIGKECGVILYESKNTENYSKDWIEKIKAEAASSKADVLVLITKAMPKGVDHTELIDGVWVCPLKEFRGTVRVLRETLLQVSRAYASQTNKEGKMQMLYDYMTSPRCAEQIKRVITSFNDLKDGYEKEKQAMLKIWKKRDAQLDLIVQNLTDFQTQIQVIGGSNVLPLAPPENDLLVISQE